MSHKTEGNRVTKQISKRAAFVRAFASVNRQFGIGEYSSTIPRRNRRKIAREMAKRRDLQVAEGRAMEVTR